MHAAVIEGRDSCDIPNVLRHRPTWGASLSCVGDKLQQDAIQKKSGPWNEEQPLEGAVRHLRECNVDGASTSRLGCVDAVMYQVGRRARAEFDSDSVGVDS